MSMKLKIYVNDEIGLYNAFIAALSTKFNITDGERKVLSVLMYFNNSIRGLDEEDRYSLLFSKSYKQKIADTAGVSKNVLENRLTSLRKKGVIEEKVLKSIWGKEVSDGDSVTYIFEIKSNG